MVVPDDTRSRMAVGDSSVRENAVGPGVAEVARTGRGPDLATPTPLELSPGTDLGAYRIVRKLGRGGMGLVFLAERAACASEEFDVEFEN